MTEHTYRSWELSVFLCGVGERAPAMDFGPRESYRYQAPIMAQKNYIVDHDKEV